MKNVHCLPRWGYRCPAGGVDQQVESQAAGTLAPACPARKQDSAGDLQVIPASGGVRVLVD